MDEVTAALQLCLRRGGIRASFWTWELVVSEETALAFDTIRHAWLLWGGGYDPAILETPCPVDPTGWIQLVSRVSAAITASGTLTAERLLARAASSPPPSPPSESVHPRVASAFAMAVMDEGLPHTESAAFWNAIAVACFRQQRTAALWLLQAGSERFCADSLWTALQMIAASTTPKNPQVVAAIKMLRETATPYPESQLLHQAAAILTIVTAANTTTSVSPTATKVSAIALRDWETWSALIDNVRAARIHAIPVDALHTGTTRGSISAKYTNDADIHDPTPLLPAACQWWRGVIQTVQVHVDPHTDIVTWPDDETLEAFYQRYFPPTVDIPDEWSVADRAKSHGRGVQETAPAAPIATALEESVEDSVWRATITQRPLADC